ncbi:MAG TPA: hypothetical protein VFV07_06440, partial [Rhizomicrobium sp.]|nr:hypothetical protein [Rhizomicrobium sp.]
MLKRLAIALAACLAASPADAQLLSWTTPDHAQVTPSPLFSDFLPVYRGPNFPPLYSTMANLPLALSQPLFGGTAVLFNGALYNNANHDPTHDQAGYSTGFWLADINPASAQYGANPAAGGAIVGSMFVDNLNNRSHGFWDLNLGVIQWGLSSGGAFSQGRGIEIDVDQSISSGITPTDPMSCGPCVDPIELIASQNTDPQTTNPERALLIWSVQPPSGNNTWFRTGVVMSRVLGSGLWFGDDTDDGDAAGTSFRRAAIEDASSSARVLY